MKRVFGGALLIVPLLAAFAAAPEVEITSEPSHHLALENEHVRVFQVEVAPKTSTLLHWHRHDYFFVSLGDSHVVNEVVDKQPVDLKLADGETRFTPGNFAHVARNLSDRPFRNVTIEFRWAEGQFDRLPAMAAELVNRPVDLLVTVGGNVAALAAKRDFPVYVDETIDLFDVVSISAGTRGLQILIAPADYLRATNAGLASLAQAKGSTR